MPFNTAEAVLACDEGIAIKIPEKVGEKQVKGGRAPI
jgi:hypothetical protein